MSYRPTKVLKEWESVHYGDWTSTLCEQLNESEIKLQLADLEQPLDESVTLLVVFGIQFGSVDAFGRPFAVKAESAARILGVE